MRKISEEFDKFDYIVGLQKDAIRYRWDINNSVRLIIYSKKLQTVENNTELFFTIPAKSG